MRTLEELLARLRFSPYRWSELDNAAIERLRPAVVSDQKVRETLMTVVLEAEYLAMPSRQCLALLLDELPDSVQVQYLLRLQAYEYRGEDAMGTACARELMCAKARSDERLRREIEQSAFTHGPGFGFKHLDYVGKDLYRDFIMPTFRAWASESSRYLPRILGEMAFGRADIEPTVRILQAHPNFPLADYEIGRHAHEVGCRLAAGAERPAPVALIRALQQDGLVEWSSHYACKHALVHSWNPEDFELIQSIAADPMDPLQGHAIGLMVKTVGTSAEARDWIENELKKNPHHRLLHLQVTAYSGDPELCRRSVEVLADVHKDWITGMQCIRQFAFVGRKYSEDWAIPFLVEAFRKIPADWKHEAVRTLRDAYPEHPETQRLIRETQPASPSGPAPDELEQLMRRATSNDHDAAQAIEQLAGRFLDRPGVRELLFQSAAEADTIYNSYAPICALLEVASRFPHEPGTRALLESPTDDPSNTRLKARLRDYYGGRRESFEELRQQMTSDDPWTRKLAIDSLALWYGDRPETFELLSTVPATLVQRWPGEERTFAVLRGILVDASSPPERVVEVARLLSRAFARHPETPGLLKQSINHRAPILAEYLGLCLSDKEVNDTGEVMNWALAVLRELKDEEAHGEIGAVGPLLLISIFGPRKTLLKALREIRTASTCPTLCTAVDELFQTYFPGI